MESTVCFQVLLGTPFALQRFIDWTHQAGLFIQCSRGCLWVDLERANEGFVWRRQCEQKCIPSHRKVIHAILSQNTLCKRLFIHIRELLAPPNTICMCKRANFNMYRAVVSAYLYIFENSWPNRIVYVCLYFRWRCTWGILLAPFNTYTCCLFCLSVVRPHG